MVRRPGVYSLIGLVVVGMFADYVYTASAALPSRRSGAGSRSGGRRGEPARFRTDGIQPYQRHDPVSAPGASLYSPETLQVIAEVHEIMQHQPGIGNVWSLETLRRWLAEKAGQSDVATLKQYVDILPQYLVRRFISADQHAVVIAGRVPDVDASKIRPIVRPRWIARLPRCGRNTPAIPSPSPAFRRSRRATAPA